MPCLETNFAKQPVRSSLLSCSLVNLCLFPGPSPSPRPPPAPPPRRPLFHLQTGLPRRQVDGRRRRPPGPRRRAPRVRAGTSRKTLIGAKEIERVGMAALVPSLVLPLADNVLSFFEIELEPFFILAVLRAARSVLCSLQPGNVRRRVACRHDRSASDERFFERESGANDSSAREKKKSLTATAAFFLNLFHLVFFLIIIFSPLSLSLSLSLQTPTSSSSGRRPPRRRRHGQDPRRLRSRGLGLRHRPHHHLVALLGIAEDIGDGPPAAARAMTRASRSECASLVRRELLIEKTRRGVEGEVIGLAQCIGCPCDFRFRFRVRAERGKAREQEHEKNPRRRARTRVFSLFCLGTVEFCNA